MLNNVLSFKGYKLDSHDGEIGKVKEFYFDDNHWAIRYLVADTGTWLTGRQVLISPHALTDVDIDQKHITVNLTKKEIEDSPSLDSDKPVSQQFEKNYYGYFGYPMYWSGPYMWGPSPYPGLALAQTKHSTPEENSWDVHLRSTHAVRGSHIESADGSIGYVDDFI
ncbi:MAG: PRC-barrel domain-containing protein, partial [Kiritimatiellae bacterium]|nr:PRC-barrel domain-containing protein [Kiritimatiellia bacterium]